MLVATYINKNYLKLDNYKDQQNFIVYIDELNDYNIGDRLEVVVDDYDIIEVIGLYVDPETTNELGEVVIVGEWV